jgi:hypothetical protein
MKSANFNWMKSMECEKSRAVSKAMKATGKLYTNIALKGKTRKAFEGYK